jgi:hypothetical protein
MWFVMYLSQDKGQEHDWSGLVRVCCAGKGCAVFRKWWGDEEVISIFDRWTCLSFPFVICIIFLWSEDRDTVSPCPRPRLFSDGQVDVYGLKDLWIKKPYITYSPIESRNPLKTFWCLLLINRRGIVPCIKHKHEFFFPIPLLRIDSTLPSNPENEN